MSLVTNKRIRAQERKMMKTTRNPVITCQSLKVIKATAVDLLSDDPTAELISVKQQLVFEAITYIVGQICPTTLPYHFEHRYSPIRAHQSADRRCLFGPTLASLSFSIRVPTPMGANTIHPVIARFEIS